jgi:hypothetical protein
MSEFTQQDAQSIIAVIEHAAPQSVKVARELIGIQERFARHCEQFFAGAAANKAPKKRAVTQDPLG